MIWRWLYDDLLGIVNRILKFLGLINESIAWLGDPSWAMIAVIMWSVQAFMMRWKPASIPIMPFMTAVAVFTLSGSLAARANWAIHERRFGGSGGGAGS